MGDGDLLPMRLLIDEDVPEAITIFLRGRGHVVEHVRDLCLNQTPDQVIDAVAERMGAIVVTFNHADFKRLAARVPRGGQGAFRKLGRVNFKCRHDRGLKRIQQVIDAIEMEYRHVQALRDKRLMIEIKESNFTIVR